MRAIRPLFFVLFSCSLYINTFAQVSVTGSTDPTSTDNDASPVVVDNALEIITDHTIDGARVSISSNFVKGDQLSFTPPTAPSTITGSYDAAKGILTFKGAAPAVEYQSVLRSVTFTANASGASNRVIEFHLGPALLYNENNHYYEYVSSPAVSWTTARNGATAKNYFGLPGYLVTITSSVENQFIHQNIGLEGWIGGSDDYTLIKNTSGNLIYSSQSNSEGNFHWVTGPEAGNPISTLNALGGKTPIVAESSYMNWDSGEPNDATNGGGQENQVVLKAINGKWYDSREDGWNGGVHGYIVEYGGLNTNEPIVNVTHTRTIIVKPTKLTTTPHYNLYEKGKNVVVDPGISVISGGMITNARVTISGNHTEGDYLYWTYAPSGITGWYDKGVLFINGTAKPSVWQAIFRTINFQTSSTGPGARTITFSVGNMISGSNGHFYEYVKDIQYTWKAARVAAAARSYMGLQGYLATITSKDENDLISQKLQADGWLGGSDEYTIVNAANNTTNYADQNASEGKFYWVEGPEKGRAISFGNINPVKATESTYTNWYNKEPNNSNTSEGGEHYLEIYSSLAGAEGQWNDLPSSSTTLPNGNSMGMVVEYGGMPTDPGIILSSSRMITTQVPLPVKDLTFHLKEKGNNVTLNWTVSQEVNVSHYDILRSSNGASFKKIGEVKALDNEGRTTYTFTDNDAIEGTNSYKIAIVDEDGKLSFSEIRAIAITGKLQVYPSIFSDYFYIDQSYKYESQVRLTNASGITYLKQTINQGSNKINTGNLASGVYFVQIFNSPQQPKVFKIVKY